MPVTEEQIQTAIDKKSIKQTKPVVQPIQKGVTDEDIQAAITKKTEIIKQEQSSQEIRVKQLFNQLRGSLPLSQQKLTGLPIQKEVLITEPQRQRAFQELQDLGFTSQQISLSLKTQKVLERPPIGRPAGGLTGAIAATAIAGRFIPGPFDDAAILAAFIAAGGAGVGGITGEAIQTGIEEKRLIGKREALNAFAIEAGTELGGRGFIRAGKFAISPFIKKTVPEAAALIDDFAKFGGNFSPTELDKRFSLSIAERFSRGSFGATEIFQEFEKRQGKAVFAFADSIIESIGEGIARQTPEQIGQAFAEGITRPGGRIFNLLDDLFKPLYDQLDDLTKSSIIKQTQRISVPSTILDETGRPVEKFVTKIIGERIKGTGVSTKSLKAFRAKLIAQNQRLVDVAKRTGKELPLISPAGKSILDDIDNLPEFVGHADYRAFRTKVLKESRKLNRDIDVSESMVKQVSSITRKELLDPGSVAGASPEAKRLHANLSNLFAKAQEGLETTFSEKLTERLLKNPSSVVKELFPNNNPTTIRTLRQSLIEPISGKPSAEGKILWNQLRQAWLSNAVDEATKEGIAKPKVFDKIIRKLGDKSLKEMFPEKQIFANVNKIQSIFDIAGQTPPTGASLFSRGSQIIGVGMMYNSGKEGDFIGFTTGTVLAIGPLAFAKLATSSQGVKFLTAGFKLKPGASGLVPNAVRMIRLLRSINKQENKQRLSEERRKSRQRRITREPTLSELRGFGGRGI